MEQARDGAVEREQERDRPHRHPQNQRPPGGEVEGKGGPDQPIGPTATRQQRLNGRWITGLLRCSDQEQRGDQDAPRECHKIGKPVGHVDLPGQMAAIAGPTTRVAKGIRITPRISPKTPSSAAVTSH